jgi:hypothetical protein
VDFFGKKRAAPKTEAGAPKTDEDMDLARAIEASLEQEDNDGSSSSVGKGKEPAPISAAAKSNAVVEIDDDIEEETTIAASERKRPNLLAPKRSFAPSEGFLRLKRSKNATTMTRFFAALPMKEVLLSPCPPL